MNESLVLSSQNLSHAILAVSLELPDLIAHQSLEENKELKLKYSALMFKLYGHSFYLQYALVTRDFTSAQSALTSLFYLRKEGH